MIQRVVTEKIFADESSGRGDDSLPADEEKDRRRASLISSWKMSRVWHWYFCYFTRQRYNNPGEDVCACVLGRGRLEGETNGEW